MENLISEKPQTAEQPTESEQERINLIPEGFVEDDALPSVFFEDLEGDKEVWLLECPVMVDPSKLLGKQLHFSHQTFFNTDEESNEKFVAIPIKENGAICCLLSSCTGQSVKAAALQNVGKIRLNISYDVPDLGHMIPDGTSVPLPEGLKMRHPFLGPKYREVLASIKNLEENIYRNSNVVKQVEVHKKKKKKLIGASNLPDISCPEKGDHSDGIERKFRIGGDGGEYTSPKISKKKKRKNIDDLAAQEESQVLGGTPIVVEHTWKKIKKEKHLTEAPDNNLLDISQTHFQEPEFRGEFSNVNKRKTSSEFQDEVMPSSKKSKKRKRESHCIDVNEVDPQEMPKIMEYDIQHVSKKIKKEKRHTDESAGEQSNSIIDISESAIKMEFSSPKKKKKKHDSHNEGNSITADESQEELAVIDDGSNQSSKKIKKKKKQVLPYEVDSSAVHSEEVVATYDGSGHGSKKFKKEKERDSGYRDNSESTEDSQEELMVIHEGSNKNCKKFKKEKERDMIHQDNSVSTECSQVELAIVHEGSSHASKKIKKEKKRNSKYQDNSVSTEDSQEELAIIHEGSSHASKKIKKEKKRDSKYQDNSVCTEDSQEEMAINEESNYNSANIKKKKKEDLSYQGHGVSTECYKEKLAIVHEESGYVSKKIKKEKKHDILAVVEHVPEEKIHERPEFIIEEGKKVKKKKKSTQ